MNFGDLFRSLANSRGLWTNYTPVAEYETTSRAMSGIIEKSSAYSFGPYFLQQNYFFLIPDYAFPRLPHPIWWTVSLKQTSLEYGLTRNLNRPAPYLHILGDHLSLWICGIIIHFGQDGRVWDMVISGPMKLIVILSTTRKFGSSSAFRYGCF